MEDEKIQNFNLDNYLKNIIEKKNVYLAEIKNLELELETKKNELYKIKGALEFAESIKANNITSIEYNNNNNLKNIPILGSLISNNE